jgi:hypothetical protein
MDFQLGKSLLGCSAALHQLKVTEARIFGSGTMAGFSLLVQGKKGL